jgi:hypothetical protein
MISEDCGLERHQEQISREHSSLQELSKLVLAEHATKIIRKHQDERLRIELACDKLLGFESFAEDRDQHGTEHTSEISEGFGSKRHQEKIRKQLAFLEEFIKLPVVKRAARAANIKRGRHYDWLKTDVAYAKLYASLEERLTGLLEDTLVERALYGVEKVVTVAGKREVIRKFDSQLLIFLLKYRRPDKYRDPADVERVRELSERLRAVREWAKAKR